MDKSGISLSREPHANYLLNTLKALEDNTPMKKEDYFDALTKITDGFGQNLIILPEAPSTNSYAIKEALPQGSVVITSTQTAGRGRSGRSWLSAENGLTFSLVLPPISAKLLTGVQIALGFAVVDALLPYADARLKWPNDIMCAGKKLAGMLMEALFEGNNPIKIVLGIGLNVAGAPKLENVASLAEFGAELPPKGVILARIVNAVDEKLLEFTSGRLNLSALWPLYSANYGKFIRFHTKDGRVVEVKEEGLTEEGFLIAEENGKREVYDDFGV